MAEQPRYTGTLETSAGLLTAGVLVTGVVLAVLELAAPALVSGAGLSAAQGPRWDRILVPLLVGIAGECARRFRHGFRPLLRPAVAAAVLLLCLVALWWGWWR